MVTTIYLYDSMPDFQKMINTTNDIIHTTNNDIISG